MGMANWVMGKMVDRFLAQPAEEKAAMFDTMASKFWEAASPQEIAAISELLLPRFLESFLSSASAEQKVEMMRSMLTSEDLQRYVGGLMPSMLRSAVDGMSSEQRLEMVRSMLDPDQAAALMQSTLEGMTGEQQQQMMQSMLDQEQIAKMLQTMIPEMLPSLLQGAMKSMPQAALQKLFGSFMPGFGSSPGDSGEKRQPPRSPGGMMPW